MPNSPWDWLPGNTNGGGGGGNSGGSTRATPDRRADDIRGPGYFTADSLRGMDTNQRFDLIRQLIGQEGRSGDIAAALMNSQYDQDIYGNSRRLTDRAGMAYLDEAFRARDTENARYQEGADLLRQQFSSFLGRDTGMGDDQIGTMFAREMDAAGRMQKDDMRFLRENLGGAGITGGGLAAGLASQIQMQRMAQITGAKRDLKIARMERDAQAALENINAAFGVAGYLNQTPSLLGADAAGNLLGLAVTRESDLRGTQAAKKASQSGLVGGLIQGGLTALGGLL